MKLARAPAHGGPAGGAAIGHGSGGLPRRLEEVTRHEEAIRDGLLGVLVDHMPPWVGPDHLTRLRLAMVLLAVALVALGVPLNPILGVLAGAAATDLVDGPLARRRRMASSRGARLDQVADAAMAGTMGIMALWLGLLDRHLVAALVVPQALGTAAALHHRVPVDAPPTTLARAQFVAVLAGFWLLLWGAASASQHAVRAGRALLYLAAALATAVTALRMLRRYPEAGGGHGGSH